jgi:hypothetical protein
MMSDGHVNGVMSMVVLMMMRTDRLLLPMGVIPLRAIPSGERLCGFCVRWRTRARSC